MWYQGHGSDGEALLRRMRARARADKRVLPWQARLRRDDYYVSYAPEVQAIIYGEVLAAEGGNRRTVRAFSRFRPRGEHGSLHVSDVDGPLTYEQFQKAREWNWPSSPEMFAAVVTGDDRYGEQYPLPWERIGAWMERKDAEELAAKEVAPRFWQTYPPEAAAL